MANLKEVRNRIKSVSSTQQITKAMKMVAAAKLRKAQDNIMQLRPYALKLNEISERLAGGEQVDLSDNPYTRESEIKSALVIVITSDRGLCGGFNTYVLKGANSLIAEKYADLNKKGNLTVLVIGKKGFEFFGKRNAKMVTDFQNVLQEATFEKVSAAAEYVMSSFVKGEYDAVDIVYNEFKNVATQVVRKEQFLPVMKVITPAPLDAKSSSKTTSVDYIFEPQKEVILQQLIPKKLKTHLFKAILESNASEQGARMTAMEKATENAGELLKELKLTYNRTRQAVITKEILEIVGGANAL
jgi:F-type H+-transporting ATPase subunit gamma